MKGMTIKAAAQACCGRLSCEPDNDIELGKFVIDSRLVEAGDIFVAFKGEKQDGHDYIKSAFDRGAACCLANYSPQGETRPVIIVPDVQDAMEGICASFRSSLNIPVVGITGSVGKTSAKEMVAAVLNRRYKVLKTDKNLNNQIGVPMTVSRIRPEHDIAVVELGISDFGEMSRLAQMARPTIALFTVIGHAHLEFLHDQDGVLEAKTEMLDYMPPESWAVVNGDDERLAKLSCRQKKLSFGLGDCCDVRAENIRTDGAMNSSCDIVGMGRRISVSIPAYGRHMVYAALGAGAIGMLLGLSDEEIAAGIADYETVGRRGAVVNTGFITLIDDSYNANPDSVNSGIDSLAALPGRKVCILGDMLEMGERERQMHYEAGQYAASRGIDALISCGPLAREMSLGAGDIGRHFESLDELIKALPRLIQKGDTVFVKASRGMHFERIAEALKTL